MGMIGSQVMFEQQVKLNLLMICFVITEEPILTNTKRKNIIQTMKTPYFLPKRKTFDEQLTEEKKKLFLRSYQNFFFYGGSPAIPSARCYYQRLQ